MADTTYINQAVYHKRKGDELVIASGGQTTVESGGEIEVESGGMISVESGGIVEFQDGFSFYLGSSSYTAGLAELKRQLYYNNRAVDHIAASVSVNPGVLVPSYIRNDAKYHLIHCGSNAVANTLWLVSAPSIGMEKIIMIVLSTAASTTNLGQSTAVTISCDAGTIILQSTHASNSRMILYASLASFGKVHLACLQTGEWAVISVSSAAAVTFT